MSTHRTVMRARRVISIAVAALVLLPLAIVGGVVLLVQSEWGERWLETQVSDRIHREVQVEDIRVQWAWPPMLHFERIRIANPDWAQTPSLIDGTNLYAARHFNSRFETALESNDTAWTFFNTQEFDEGAFEMATDPVNGILYSANIRAGVYALKLP